MIPLLLGIVVYQECPLALNSRFVSLQNPSEMAHFAGSSASDGEAFWTACPHCCYVHSYPRLYVGRRLRCPTASCLHAFSADELPSAPPIVPGTEMYFCTWAFYPLGPPAVPQGWTPFTPFNSAHPPSPSPPPTATPSAAAGTTRVGPTSRKKVGVCLKGRARVEAEEEEKEEVEEADTVASLKAESGMETDWLSLGDNCGSEININETVELRELGFRDDEMEFFQGML